MNPDTPPTRHHTSPPTVSYWSTQEGRWRPDVRSVPLADLQAMPPSWRRRIERHLEGRSRAPGRPPLADEVLAMTVRVPKEMMTRLDDRARQDRVSKAEIVRLAIEELLDA